MRQLIVRLIVVCLALGIALSASSSRSGAQAATNTPVPTRPPKASSTPLQAATASPLPASATLALILGNLPGASGCGNSLYTFNTDGKDGKLLRPSDGTNYCLWNKLSWSPDGNYLAYYDGKKLTVTDADGSNANQVSNSSLFAWTADSTQLTTRSGSEVPLENINVLTGKSTPLFTLSKTVKYVDYLRWSPDGTRLLYVGSAQSGQNEIHSVDADGSNDQIVVPASNIARYAMWSSDGQKIAYLTGGGNTPAAGINIVDLVSKKATKIGQGALAADWSPDGNTFVFADGNGQLFLINADGSNKRAIPRPADLKGYTVAIAWRPPVKPKAALPISTSAATAAASSGAGAADGMQTYLASDKSFSFAYPTGWKMQDSAAYAKLPGLDTTVFESPYAVIVAFISDATISQVFASAFAGGTPLEINGKKVARADKCPLQSKGIQLAYLMTLDTQKSVLICAFPKSADELKAIEPALEAILASVQAPAAQ